MRRTHGLSGTIEHTAWARAKSRCFYASNKSYPQYGGRGITMCNEWRQDFTAFLRDMGPRPSDCTSLDRIDSNGNYEPGNCRWADAMIQGNNTSRNVRVTLQDGTTAKLSDIVRMAGVPYAPLYYAIQNLGLDVDAAIKKVKAKHLQKAD